MNRLLTVSAAAMVMVAAAFPIDRNQKNSMPVVKFVAPGDSGPFAMTSFIPYKVTVSDKEDGESKYDEIPSTEVFIETRYFADATKGIAYEKSPLKKDPEGFAILKKQDCFTCHATWNKLIGPSFNEIAARYKIADTTLLAGHVIKGSSGRWGSTAMPTHPSLSITEAQQIVRWIMENSSDPDVDYLRGSEGAVRLHASKDLSAKGVLVLQASYADHGLADQASSSLTGYDRTLLKLK